MRSDDQASIGTIQAAHGTAPVPPWKKAHGRVPGPQPGRENVEEDAPAMLIRAIVVGRHSMWDEEADGGGMGDGSGDEHHGVNEQQLAFGQAEATAEPGQKRRGEDRIAEQQKRGRGRRRAASDLDERAVPPAHGGGLADADRLGQADDDRAHQQAERNGARRDGAQLAGEPPPPAPARLVDGDRVAGDLAHGRWDPACKRSRIVMLDEVRHLT